MKGDKTSLKYIVAKTGPWLSLIFVTSLAIQYNSLSRWNLLLYDMQITLSRSTPPDDIIIVAIDELSIKKLGRWPWPRSIHARLIDTLSNEEARVIGLDLIISEPSKDKPEDDARLAHAVRANGKTILPVLVEQKRTQGVLTETLPIPALVDAAAALGHAHIELDKDGIARSVYLKEGLGSPYWPSFALAVLNFSEPGKIDRLPGTVNPDKYSESPYVWARNHKILIPYSGPAGHFHTISYSNVLEGQYLQDTFKDKIVLVGATAAGMGDALPTPVSGHTHSMPGVEINAHILNALRNGINIVEMPTFLQISVSSAFILLTAFLYNRNTPKWNLISTAILIVVILLLSILLLHSFQIWFSPAATILALVLCYPLWSWRRLENAMGYLNKELETLNSEKSIIPSNLNLRIPVTLDFFQQILPVNGWTIFTESGVTSTSRKNSPDRLPDIDIPRHQWISTGDTYWLDASSSTSSEIIALQWSSTTPPSREEQALLDDLLQRYKSTHTKTMHSTVEIVQKRIQEVKQATVRMRALKQFISDTISQMGDGILVISPLGEVTIANEKAITFLEYKTLNELQNLELFKILKDLKLNDSSQWTLLVQGVLLHHQSKQVEARHRNGLDLLVQMTPLDRSNRELGGMVITLSDISALKNSERRRAELLGFLSHDLRTPLVSLLALLEIAKARKQDTATHALLGRMDDYAQNTIDLADQFLHLAKAENSEYSNFQECELTSIALNAIEKIWTQASRKNIEISYDLDIEDAWIMADPDLIERALINLLSNAIKYSPVNSPVSLEIEHISNSFRCCVTDKGRGIEEKDIPNLFERFYRSSHPGNLTEKGAGLGLAFVNTVATHHNGTIDVSSRINEGSQFCLILPSYTA